MLFFFTRLFASFPFIHPHKLPHHLTFHLNFIIIFNVSRPRSNTRHLKSRMLSNCNARPLSPSNTRRDLKLRRSVVLPPLGYFRHFLLLPTVYHATPAQLSGGHDLHLHQHLLCHRFYGLLSHTYPEPGQFSHILGDEQVRIC